MMMSFTCNTCEVEYDDVESHRSHYKSDWHRYNLRRRQVELAPGSLRGVSETKSGGFGETKKGGGERGGGEITTTSMICVEKILLH